MWIKVISLRSPTAKLVSLLAIFFASILIFKTPAPTSVPVKASIPGPVYRVITSERAMALTINVVWGTEYVPKLLDVLMHYHVKATFMVGGVWAKNHPQLVQEMVRDGMQVGNHGWAHGHPANMSVAENLTDIAKTNNAVKHAANVVPTVYAPPYGELGTTVLTAAAELHMPVIMWTIDTIDWRPSSDVPYMVNKVLQKAQPGAIVLMHPTNRTVEALGQIIHGLQSQGYHLVTISALLKMGIPTGDG
ncbi:polysaccharide deacetylase family protein [Sulfobacillus thermosulfidooxidans]|uniref:polysaccharide deacetylase family protein n=1 Tax=Sulfobacillus thermosulfidooxidans TaxID=28034 RepID=UPI0004075103|nr:polysaccharide deacetylase family protein [Sulfobacillus thermosulfidooxidans]